MKAKITKKNGDVVELEGTAAELGAFIDSPTAPPPSPPPHCPGIADKGGLGKFLDELTRPACQRDQGAWDPRPFPQTLWSDTCSDGGLHEFPDAWLSVSPPACKKCGFRGLGISSLICTNEARPALEAEGEGLDETEGEGATRPPLPPPLLPPKANRPASQNHGAIESQS